MWSNKGAWELQRERQHTGISRTDLAPARIMGDRGRGGSAGHAAAWAGESPVGTGSHQRVGIPRRPQVAKRARAGRLERKVLHIFVDHPAWLSDLSRYGQKQIIEKPPEEIRLG